MCRMILVREKSAKSKHASKIVNQSVKYWAINESQKDGCGIGYIENGILTIEKTGHSAELVEFTGDAYKSKIVLGHVRMATQGNIEDKNSHPFTSEDGKMMLMHNGNISGFEKLKSYLIKRGHEFESETDSEILLHSIEEWGIKKFIAQMQEWGVTGYANWIMLEKNGRITAYSDGAIFISNTDASLIIATNTSPFKSRAWEKLKSGHAFVMEPDGEINVDFVGYFPASYTYSSSVKSDKKSKKSKKQATLDDIRYDIDSNEWDDFRQWIADYRSVY